jgi:hypothetical protein
MGESLGNDQSNQPQSNPTSPVHPHGANPPPSGSATENWQQRLNELPKLQTRTKGIFKAILGNVPVSDEYEPAFPEDMCAWLSKDYNDLEDDIALNDRTELFDCMASYETVLTLVTMATYTPHKYIKVHEHQNQYKQLGAKSLFTNERIYNILVHANLARLVIDLIKITSEWDHTSPEERALLINQIELMFPAQFTPTNSRKGSNESIVLMELRTQVFVQNFMEALQSDLLGEWNTNNRIQEIFRTEREPEVPVQDRMVLPHAR